MAAERCADLAVTTLGEAVASGAKLPADWQERPAFSALDGHPGFAALFEQP